ncbi:MAG: hypothetical protein ACLR0U_20285 [Enterocloster clostridioformis]
MAAGERLERDRGELQPTDYGLSGIPVFQVSRFAARALDQGKRVTALVDFMPSTGMTARHLACLKSVRPFWAIRRRRSCLQVC